MAEGTRLLSEYGAKSSIAGSNPALSAGGYHEPLPAPVAQLDRASVYGTEGQRFESSRARHRKAPLIVEIGGAFALFEDLGAPLSRPYPGRGRGGVVERR